MYNNEPASRLVPFGLLHVAKSIDLCQNIFLLTAYQLVLKCDISLELSTQAHLFMH